MHDTAILTFSALPTGRWELTQTAEHLLSETSRMLAREKLREQDVEVEEKLLASEDGDGTDHGAALQRRKSASSQPAIIVHFIIEAVLLAVVLLLLTGHKAPADCQINFTPAREAIRYETRKFNAGYLKGEKSKYQLDCEDCKPTDEIDAAWSDLYHGLMWSKIPRTQAAQLRNLTINIPGNEDHYLIGLDVFHLLHCLDNVRKGLWPQRYNPDELMGGQGMSLLSPKHLDHCVDQLRQAVMCQSDLTPNWLYWDDHFGTNLAARDVEHSCRSFDDVVDWAREHAQEPFDLKIRLNDPLKDNKL